MYWHPRVEIPNQVPECDIPSYHSGPEGHAINFSYLGFNGFMG